MHRFQKYQDLPTKGAIAVEQFSINGSLFLAFANQYGDTRGYNTDSFIYKLNDSSGKFSRYQTKDTTGAHDIEYFTIAGQHYLAVANRLNGTTHQQNSVIYRWNGYEFVTLQNIPINSATSVNFFEILQELFLAVTNALANSAVIYKWKDNQFETFQKIGTEGSGHASTAFKINNETFIAFANWPTASSFSFTHGASAWYPFVMCGETFLGVANFRDDRQSYTTKSVIYRYSGERFIQYQEIPTQGAWDMTSFEYNGHTYLAIANYKNNNGKHNINSAVYNWI